jgi:hypothetical protein
MPATKSPKLRPTPERLAVLTEFDIAMATPSALAIAEALIEARKDSALLDWLHDQLTKQGNVIDFTREIDETNELAIMVYRGPQHGREAGCTHWIAGDYDVRRALCDARDNGETNEAAYYAENSFLKSEPQSRT